MPTFKFERQLIMEGYRSVVGVDEAGCGALAGPLVAAAVIFPLNSRLAKTKDSKFALPKLREELFDLICERSNAWGVGIVSVAEIEELGLRPANYLAMRRAIEKIPEADYALVDAWTIPNLPIPQRGIIKGDQLVKSIAAASIIAKVTRDRLMVELAKQFPNYQFEKHKGYATKTHRDAIKKHGPCPAHRLGYKTFHD